MDTHVAELPFDLLLGNASLSDLCIRLKTEHRLDSVLLDDVSNLININWSISNYDTAIGFYRRMEGQLELLCADALFKEGAISLIYNTINNVDIILIFIMRILLFVELSRVLTWILDAELSEGLCFLMLVSEFVLFHISILNLVVFVALKLTFITSENIVEMHRTSKWLNSLAVFAEDPISIHGSSLHLVHSHALSALKIKLRIMSLAWFEQRKPDLVFLPLVTDLDVLQIEVSNLTIFHLAWIRFDSRKDIQICDTINAGLPILEVSIFCHYIFIRKMRLAGNDWIFSHPNMAFSPPEFAFKVFPFAHLLDGTNSVNLFARHCLILNLQVKSKLLGR